MKKTKITTALTAAILLKDEVQGEVIPMCAYNYFFKENLGTFEIWLVDTLPVHLQSRIENLN